MTHTQLLRSVDSRELALWRAFYRVEAEERMQRDLEREAQRNLDKQKGK